MRTLGSDYRGRHSSVLVPAAKRLQAVVSDLLGSQDRVDRVSARAKSVERFLAKAGKVGEDKRPKYTDPLRQIQDQLGVRVVVFYSQDVERISEIVVDYFRAIEDQSIVPESESEFGYVGKHFVLFVPDDVFSEGMAKELRPKFFELQIKTLFQHAWAEANHDLAYKAEEPLTAEERRKIAFTAAQAWGADMIFQELFEELAPRAGRVRDDEASESGPSLRVRN